MLLSTTYFGPVSWYCQLAQSTEPVIIDPTERFQKQTLRSRCRIATANGIQVLSVPVTKGDGDIRSVRISDHGNWRHLHWQALSSAYGSSPFFEYYADDIRPFFEKRWDFLYDYNMEIIEKMKELLDLNTHHPAQPKGMLARARTPNIQHPSPITYYQTFQSRHGFIPDLSILDLLFNMGPESILYLL